MIKLFPTYISFSSFKFPRKDWWGIKSKDAASPSVPALTLHLSVMSHSICFVPNDLSNCRRGKFRVLNSRRHSDPLCQDVGQFYLTPRITLFWESATELTVKCKGVNTGLFKMAVQTIPILFPSCSSDSIHLSVDFISYKLSKIFQTLTV